MVDRIFRAIWRSPWFDTGFTFGTFGLVVLYGYLADQASPKEAKLGQWQHKTMEDGQAVNEVEDQA